MNVLDKVVADTTHLPSVCSMKLVRLVSIHCICMSIVNTRGMFFFEVHCLFVCNQNIVHLYLVMPIALETFLYTFLLKLFQFLIHFTHQINHELPQQKSLICRTAQGWRMTQGSSLGVAIVYTS